MSNTSVYRLFDDRNRSINYSYKFGYNSTRTSMSSFSGVIDFIFVTKRYFQCVAERISFNCMYEKGKQKLSPFQHHVMIHKMFGYGIIHYDARPPHGIIYSQYKIHLHECWNTQIVLKFIGTWATVGYTIEGAFSFK